MQGVDYERHSELTACHLLKIEYLGICTAFSIQPQWFALVSLPSFILVNKGHFPCSIKKCQSPPYTQEFGDIFRICAYDKPTFMKYTHIYEVLPQEYQQRRMYTPTHSSSFSLPHPNANLRSYLDLLKPSPLLTWLISLLLNTYKSRLLS